VVAIGNAGYYARQLEAEVARALRGDADETDRDVLTDIRDEARRLAEEIEAVLPAVQLRALRSRLRRTAPRTSTRG
jgi:hypothetical protein